MAIPPFSRRCKQAATRGLSFGAPTEAEIELAEAIIAQVPSVEQVRLVSSGTEAAMSAIRLARGATGRSKLIKFEGCYHGHADALLVKAGSGLATFGHPTSAGVPPEVVQHTIVLEYNTSAATRSGVRRARARLGVRDDRADRRQHELRAHAGGLHEAAARAVHAERRAAGVRRGDDRLSRRPRRGAKPLRRGDPRLQARHQRVRQGHRRRHAAGRVRHHARRHAAARPAGPGVPGRHAERQPGGHRLRPRHAARNRQTGFFDALVRPDPFIWSRRCLRLRATAASRSAPTAKAACSASSSARVATTLLAR